MAIEKTSKPSPSLLYLPAFLKHYLLACLFSGEPQMRQLVAVGGNLLPQAGQMASQRSTSFIPGMATRR
jgi:hypothetical protein